MAFDTMLLEHLARYPSMQIQDVYKLIHQGALGSEHANLNPQSARTWMERELAEMSDGPNEPLIDPVSEDGQIVRVHLRPFVAQGGSPGTLLAAFLRTANEYRGDAQLLNNHWKIALSLGNYPVAEMEDFFRTMQAKGFPAARHSPEYSQLYRPAYRVVWRKFISNTNS